MFKLGEIRKGFLELMSFSLGTLSALCRGDGSFKEHGGRLCGGWGGTQMGTGSAALEARCAWLERSGAQIASVVMARSKEEGPGNEQ